jgi:DNA-binding NarL/FixJ family response regulator
MSCKTQESLTSARKTANTQLDAVTFQAPEFRQDIATPKALTTIQLEMKPGMQKEALARALESSIDLSEGARVVITDSLPQSLPVDGIPRILLIDNPKEKLNLKLLQEHGVCGVIDSSTYGIDELQHAIDTVSRGLVYMRSDQFQQIDRHLEGTSPERSVLSRREMEVAALCGQRLTNKEIARIISRSELTVKNHIRNARGKLGGLKNRHELGDWYVTHGSKLR